MLPILICAAANTSRHKADLHNAAIHFLNNWTAAISAATETISCLRSALRCYGTNLLVDIGIAGNLAASVGIENLHIRNA